MSLSQRKHFMVHSSILVNGGNMCSPFSTVVLLCTCRLTGRIQQCNMFPNQTFLMNARLQRLGRYYEGKPVLVWCYPLQELPNAIRVDGDGDWAPTTELLRRSTGGGAVRYGLHTWIATQSHRPRSAESEFYATGSATARGLQCKV